MILVSDAERQQLLDAAAISPRMDDVAKAMGWTTRQLVQRLRNDPALYADFRAAKEIAMDIMVDGLQDVTDRELDVQRARLKSDNIKWLAERLAPRQYGVQQRMELNVTGSIDLAAAIAQGNQRLMRDITPSPAALPGYESNTYEHGHCDNQSLNGSPPPSLDDLLS